MGLLAEFDIISDFGYPEELPYGIVPDYSFGNSIFISTFNTVVNSLVPVDTGYLMSSITATNDGSSFSVYTDCEYAQYPEFGTWCQAAQPYFTPALEEAIYEAEMAWDNALRIAVEEYKSIQRAEQQEMEEEGRETQQHAQETRADAVERRQEEDREHQKLVDLARSSDRFVGEIPPPDHTMSNMLFELSNIFMAIAMAMLTIAREFLRGIFATDEDDFMSGSVYVPEVIIT